MSAAGRLKGQHRQRGDMSTIYITATPIGNLEDITLRALRVLKEVDLVVAEDTRVTKKLFGKYDIHTKLIRYDEHSHKKAVKTIIDFLKGGKDIALVADAGTPTISDPGHRLVREIKNIPNVSIVPIPGPSAVTTALSVSGIKADNFLFLGFLPHKKGRETLFKKIQDSKETVVFYESPHRILKTIKKLPDNREIVVCKELTKLYERVISGTRDEVLKKLDNTKGEFVIVVSGK